MTSFKLFFSIKPVSSITICCLVFPLLFFIFNQNGYAQEIISTNGDSYSNASAQLSWTIGEPVIETFASGANTLTQGFQQSNLTVTAIDLITQSGITLKVYPNPVPDVLIIERMGDVSQSINLKLFDISGKLLIQEKMEHNTQTLNMQVFRSGNYLLGIYSDTGVPLQSFKVSKK